MKHTAKVLISFDPTPDIDFDWESRCVSNQCPRPQ